MAELRKCPFCGGEVKIVPEQIDARTVAYNFVCDECCSSTYFDYADREESIEQWNNRATESEIRHQAITDFVEHITLPLTTEEDIARILEQLGVK